MRIIGLAIAAITVLGCGGDDDDDRVPLDPEAGPIERACHELANRYCCGWEDDLLFGDCYLYVKYSACSLLGGGACPGGCIRSSVDFAACNATLDAIPDLCAPCTDVDCRNLPMECISDECRTPEDGCAEDP